MIILKIRGKEIITIPKEPSLERYSIIATIYTTILILTMFFQPSYGIDTPEVRILILGFGIGYVFALLMFIFSRRFFINPSMLIEIEDNQISKSGGLTTNQTREFDIDDYTRIVVREKMPVRLTSKWFATLYVGRKYIDVYWGHEREIAIKLGIAISTELGIDYEMNSMEQTGKKRASRIAQTLGMSILILPFIVLFYDTIPEILFMGLFFLIIAFVVIALVILVYYTNK